MVTVDPVALRALVDTVLADGQEVVSFLENVDKFPFINKITPFVNDVQTVLGEVLAFLDSTPGSVAPLKVFVEAALADAASVVAFVEKIDTLPGLDKIAPFVVDAQKVLSDVLAFLNAP